MASQKETDKVRRKDFLKAKDKLEGWFNNLDTIKTARKIRLMEINTALEKLKYLDNPEEVEYTNGKTEEEKN